MGKRTAVEPVIGPRDARSPRPDPSLWVVPRRWVLVMAALIVVPWFIAAALYSHGSSGIASDASSRPAASAGAGPSTTTDPRPWGQLVLTPIVISPPLEYVPSNWGPIEAPRWYFPRATRADVGQFLAATGLTPEQTALVLSTTREDAGGLVATPDPSLVRGLDPNVRAQIYVELSKSARNDRQRNAYRYFATSSEAWFGQSLISPRTRQAAEPYVYRVGDFLYFADIDLARREIDDPSELQRLAKRLLREATMIVELRIEDRSQLDAAVEYWGRGGRRTDIRPLLESIASTHQDHSIDISHLLPTFARQHLYRYPRVTLGDLDKPSFFNCFWTALNFFNTEPDDRYLDAKVAVDRLKRDYFIVHDQFQLGDVAAFVDPNGEIFHAAVYLADGLVFGKNGTSPLSPWTIVPIDRLKGYYLEHAEHWQVIYYRRKDI